MYNPDKECKEMIDALRRICNKKGIKPHALAQKAGISASTISYILNGKTKPQVYTMLILCNALGIKITDLFERESSYTSLNAHNPSSLKWRCITREEARLLENYRIFSEKKKYLLKIYIDMLHEYDERWLDGRMMNK